jgi:hypothetical protein
MFSGFFFVNQILICCYCLIAPFISHLSDARLEYFSEFRAIFRSYVTDCEFRRIFPPWYFFWRHSQVKILWRVYYTREGRNYILGGFIFYDKQIN